MQVWVEMQILTPGMEHGQAADGGAQEPGVGGSFQQGLGSGTEQNGVDLFRVLKCQPTDLLWKSEHHVEIGDRQKLRFSLLEPSSAGRGLALGTMTVAAGNGELTITCLMGSNSLWRV